MAKYKVDELLI